MSTPSPDAVDLALRLGSVLGAAALPATLDQELRAATASVRAVFGAAACSVALVQEDGESLRFAAADGIGADAIVGVVIGADRGLVGWVAMAGQPIAVADVRADPRFARDIAESTEYVPRAILAAPLLRRDGEVLGVMEVLDATGDAGTGRDLDVLALIAAQLAVVVQLAGRYDRLGAMVVAGLTGEEEDAALVDRIVAAAGDEDAELRSVASVVARLAASGPRGARLVRQVLDAVEQYSTGRR